MATAAERMRAHRERVRRRIRRLTIDVSEDDLQRLAERGYEGAESPDPQGQAQAVALFVTDAVVMLDSRGCRRHSPVAAQPLHRHTGGCGATAGAVTASL